MGDCGNEKVFVVGVRGVWKFEVYDGMGDICACALVCSHVLILMGWWIGIW